MVKKIIKKITPSFLIKTYHYLWALVSALFYRFPSRKMKVIGVTGTNGKSTTVKLIAEILKEAGKNVAVVSSISFEVTGVEQENKMKMTMPGRGFLQKFLRKARKKSCECVVLEVTSEGIEQFRHKFINFNVAVITNLAPEHIESHGSFEAYKRAKGKLFRETNDLHILNSDDEYTDFFKSFYSDKKWGYGLELNDELDEFILGKEVKSESGGVEFKVDGKSVKTNLLGKFNIYNCLAAISVAKYMDINLTVAKKTLADVEGISGRMEEVISAPFKVYLDYAFTPNALEQVYKDLRQKEKPKKMIAILGACGGGRDKWKRPVLGELADKFADEVIITNEDPYDEDPEEIINQVAKKIKNPRKIIDRREAINKALELAERGDVVIVTGKGSESWIQVANGKKLPWSDKEVIKEEFNKLYAEQTL